MYDVDKMVITLETAKNIEDLEEKIAYIKSQYGVEGVPFVLAMLRWVNNND